MKIKKVIIALCLAVVAAVTCAMVAACGEDGSGGTNTGTGTPPATVYTFDSCSMTIDGENRDDAIEGIAPMYEGTTAYFKDERFCVTMYGGELSLAYTYTDGGYDIDYDMSNMPGAEGITTAMRVDIDGDTLTMTFSMSDSSQFVVQTYIYKA